MVYKIRFFETIRLQMAATIIMFIVFILTSTLNKTIITRNVNIMISIIIFNFILYQLDNIKT